MGISPSGVSGAGRSARRRGMYARRRGRGRGSSVARSRRRGTARACALRVTHQTRGVHERQTDPLTVVGELLAVEIGPEVALVDRDARSAGQGVDPVAQALDDEVAHGTGTVVELEGGRHEEAAAGKLGDCPQASQRSNRARSRGSPRGIAAPA